MRETRKFAQGANLHFLILRAGDRGIVTISRDRAFMFDKTKEGRNHVIWWSQTGDSGYLSLHYRYK